MKGRRSFFGKRVPALLLVVLMACSILLMGFESKAYTSDGERHRLNPDPQIEALVPPVPTQVCKTSLRLQRNNLDYYTLTGIYSGAVKYMSDDQTVAATMNHTYNLMQDIGALGSSMGDYELASAATNPNKYVTADVLSVIDLAPTDIQVADGKYQFVLGIPTATPGDKILVLHYNGAGWENIVPWFVGGNTVGIRADSMATFAVVRFYVTDYPPVPWQ